jgi:Domain of unknown function (DUF4404)
MALDSLIQLEARIHQTHDLNPQQKEEFLRLISELKAATADFSTTHDQPTQRRTHVNDSSPQVATGQDTSQHPLRTAMEDLATSVEAFEASHPEVVNAVNRLSTLLANMGI